MGAWGIGNFENDEALDWLTTLSTSADDKMIEMTLRNLVDLGDSEYLEAPQAFEGLAAAEVVAALGGAPADGLPNEIAEWVQQQSARQGTSIHVALALRAAHRIKAASEVKDLHDEAGSSLEWNRVIDELQVRLSSLV